MSKFSMRSFLNRGVVLAVAATLITALVPSLHQVGLSLAAPGIIDVNIECTANPTPDGWDFKVRGWQGAGPTTQVKIHMPWAPYAVEGPGAGTETSYHQIGKDFPNGWTASAETFAVVDPPHAGSLTQCMFPNPGSPDLTVSKTGPASIIAGNQITYTVTVTNPGNAIARDVSVSDVYPAELTYVSSSFAGCQAATNGSRIIACQIGDLDAGQNKSITFTFTVAPTALCKTITNKAEIGASNIVPANAWSMVSTTTNCPQVPQLVCTPTTQTVAINANATLTATGGTGTYAWSAPTGDPATGNSASFVTKYATSGTKTVTLTSGTQTATCTVVVTPPTPPQLVCSPATQTVLLNANANLTATGGNGTYAWSAPAGDPATGSTATFTTKYNTIGTKTVTVTSGTQTATCSVVVNPIPGECNLEITKSVNKTDAQPNEEVSYVLNFKNKGTANCTNVTVTDVIDPMLTYLRETHSGNILGVVYNQTSRVVTISAGTFSPNETGIVTIVVKVSSTIGACADRDIANVAKITASQYNNGQNAITSNTVHTRVKTNCPPPQLVCNPNTQSVALNTNANMTATGGNGTYAWSAPAGNPANGNGASFATKYATSGTKTVTVVSGTQSATCSVVVTEPVCTTNCGGNVNAAITVEKLVRNITQGGGFAHSISARPGDRVEYQVRVRNNSTIGTTTLTLNDVLSNQTVLTSFGNLQVSRTFSGTLANNGVLSVGLLDPNQEVIATYQYTVRNDVASGASICNTVAGRAINTTPAADTACVTVATVQGSNVALSFSKRAFNDTKNRDATTVPASREDFITYTLTVTNTGNSGATNFTITDDLSGVLPLADMVDFGGGTVTNNVISYPPVTVPAGGSVSKQFRVRVKYGLATNISYVMRNTYGNTVTITINPPPTYVPPKTGGMTQVLGGIGFAGLLTAGFALHRKKNLAKLIFS